MFNVLAFIVLQTICRSNSYFFVKFYTGDTYQIYKLVAYTRNYYEVVKQHLECLLRATHNKDSGKIRKIIGMKFAFDIEDTRHTH